MKITYLAALLATTALAMSAVPAYADSGSGSDGGGGAEANAKGCVSNAEYRRLGLGQSPAHIRSVAGADALISRRSWDQGGASYRERLYAMCTPSDRDHDILTTRYTRYHGAWRAIVVDTLVGPERA
jgi:hypothetical protein